MKSAPWKQRPEKTPVVDPISSEVRALIKLRSGGRCEFCGAPGQHLHHRQLRRAGDHSASNIVNTCAWCHKRLHGHVAYATEIGWLVSQYGVASETPILMDGEWWVLTVEGMKQRVKGPVR